MSSAAVASIAIAALALAAVSTVAHFVPLGQMVAPEPPPAAREKPSDPAPSAAPAPPPTPEPVRAPTPPPVAPAAPPAPAGSPPFPPHPMFARYMAGSTPSEILERYDKQPSYRSWFDGHFGSLTIRQATGFAASPLPSGSPALAPVPAQTQPPPPAAPAPTARSNPDPDPRFVPYMTNGDDPQVYVNRYNSDPAYKAWFDANFEELTIQRAAGLGSAPTQQPLPLPPPPVREPDAPRPPPPPVERDLPPIPEYRPEPPPAPAPTPPERDNTAECNKLLSQLLNTNTPVEEFNRIEAELITNNCGS